MFCDPFARLFFHQWRTLFQALARFVCRLDLFTRIPGVCVPRWCEWVMREANRPLRAQRETGQFLGELFHFEKVDSKTGVG